MRDADRRVRAARGRAAWATVTGAWAVAAAACTHQPPPPSRLIRFESRVAEGTLANGMTVVAAEDHATNLVAVGIRVEAGSASDPPGKAGLAHLVEHLAFQVQPGGRAVAADLSAAAVDMNAITKWDSTEFYVVARADQLDHVLALEAARMSAPCSSIPEGSFEREREVVRNELRLHEAAAMVTSLRPDRVLAALYPADHPYHRPVGGDDAQVARLTRDDACAYMAAHYQPDRMTVVVTGDIDAHRAVREVGRTLGPLRGRAVAAAPRFPPLGDRGRTVHVKWPVDRPAAVVAWPLPPEGAPGRPAAELAFRMVANAPGMPGDEDVLGGPRAPLGVLWISGKDEAERDRRVAELWEAYDRLLGLRGGGEPWRFRMLFQNQLNAAARRVLSDYDSLTSRVIGLADALEFEGERYPFVRGLMALDKLTGSGEMKVAHRVLDRARATVLLVDPSGSAPSGPRRSPLSYAGRSNDDAWEAPVDAANASRPLDVPMPASSLVRAHRFRLDCGLQVIVLPEATDPLMSARLVFAGGSADDPPGHEGQARLAASLLRPPYRWNGWSHGTAVAEALVRLGDDLESEVGLEYTVLSADGLSSHMDALLAGLASEVESADYTDQQIEDSRKKADGEDLSRRARASLDLMRQADRSLLSAVFGEGHPYSRPVEGRPGKALSADGVQRFARLHYSGLNGVLIVTGKVDPDQVRAQAAYYFRDLPTGAPFDLVRPPAARHARRLVDTMATNPLEPVTDIRVAFPLARSRPLRAARLVMARMLQHRVNRLREVLGASYVASAGYVDNRRGPGMLLIDAPVDQARAGEALVAILAEVKAVRERPGDMAEDFVRARREVLAHVLAQESGTLETASRLVDLVERGDPLDEPGRLARRVAGLTLDEVSKQAARDLDERGEFVGLLGPAASIAAARKQAGL